MTQSGLDMGHLSSWIGRSETHTDVAAAAPLARLAALLDYEEPPWVADRVPPLGHWLYFLPRVRQSMLDVDGHPRRGDFLPPVPLPRRMWAGGRLTFAQPIPVEARIERRSTIANVLEKKGTGGSMVFVTIRHEITVAGQVAIVEEQDLLYREAVTGATAAAPASRSAASGAAAASRTVSIDSTALLRYSALTFNSHRIHYDLEYAREVERYPDLVVHGPLLATLLMDWFLRHGLGTVTGFTFRARWPAFRGAPLQLCMGEVAAVTPLWALDERGVRCMTAEVNTG